MKIETFPESTRKFQIFSKLKKNLMTDYSRLFNKLFIHKSNCYEHVLVLCPKYTVLFME